jgi:hypothetical protein
MNHCHHITAMLDDYLDQHLDDVELRLIHRHLNRCASCEAIFRHAQAVHLALREWLDQLSCEESARTVLARTLGQLSDNAAPSTPRSHWRPALLAASLAMMFVVGGYLMPWGAVPHTDQVHAVMLRTSEIRPVQISLETVNPIERVTLTLELPAHVSLAGYPAEQVLVWETSLNAGINQLSLPLQALSAGEGNLRLTVSSPGGFHSTQIIRLHSKDGGSPQVRASGADKGRMI